MIERGLINRDVEPDAVYSKVIVSVDPPFMSPGRDGVCGIIVAGLYGIGGDSPGVHIIHDGTLGVRQPVDWARSVCSLAAMWRAQYVLADLDAGYGFVSSMINMVDPDVVVRGVKGRKSRSDREDPVAALYQSGRVRHREAFNRLEDELGARALGRIGAYHRRSALVWAVWDLLLQDDGSAACRIL